MDSQKKIISIIIPTRNRHELVRRFLNSVNQTAKDFFSFEIILVIDNDDIVSRKSLFEYQAQYTAIDIRIVSRGRNENISDMYYNWLWREGLLNGDYFWVMGDDVIMITKDWDKLVIEGIEKYLIGKSDRICCAFAIDTSSNKPSIKEAKGKLWGWFPIITREACEAVNFILPKQYPAHGADIYLARLYNAIHRYCPLLNIKIHTKTHRTEGVPNDKIAENVGRIAKEYSKHAVENFAEYFKTDVTLLGEKIHERVGKRKPVQQL